jgi:alpha-beta hydrolase superfamily lysophospholipase
MIEDSFPARDGLKLYQRRWQPGGTPRAEVLLVHGFIEHSGRYAAAAESLVGHDWAVTAADLRGHGKSDGARCWVRSFDEYVDDLDLCFERTVALAAGRPLFLLGHSLGGLIAVLWYIRRRPTLNGLILSGPALEVNKQIFPWLQHLARVGSVLFPRLRLVRMGARNISRDPQVVTQFRDDPLVFHGRFPVRTGAEILRAGRLARGKFEAVRVPLLILHGTADRVAAVEASQDLFRRAVAADKTLRLYPGLYHEVLNEPEKEQVLKDLIEWIDQRAA